MRHATSAPSLRSRIGARPHRWVSILTTAALILGAAPVVTALSLLGAPAPAEAATITVSAPQARMDTHYGWTGATGSSNAANGDRYRFGSAPTSTTTGFINNTGGFAGNGSNGGFGGTSPYYADGNTAWVSNGTTAWTAHGYDNNPSASETRLHLSDQSAIGFEPASLTQVETGQIFNLGRMVHSNNPVTVTNDWFQGDLDIRFMGADMSYRWRMNETPNSCSGANCSDDLTDFLNQVSNQTVTSGGLTYTLVVRGFTAPNSGSTGCQANPTTVNPINQFRTVEGTRTYGCLYASLEQVRQVTVKKVVASPYGTAPNQSFAFTSTSTLAGSPWSAPGTASLTSNGTFTRAYNSGEQITISEGAQSAPWSFTSLSCVDGTGAAIGTVSGQTVTIPRGSTASSAAAAPITCTYTNTYTPRATLTLVKNVTATGQPTPQAAPADWTLRAQGQGTISSQSISGPGNSAAVTSQSVIAGTYVLSETPNNPANTGGYVQDGDWTCTAGTISTTGGVTSVTLSHGQSATCTVKNKYQTGSLSLTKTVTGGGYTGGTTKGFDVQYSCVADGRTVSGTRTLFPAGANGTAGSAVVVTNLPAGATCTVTETPPTGGLVNSSWVWATAAFNPNPAVVVIPAGGTASVNVTNPTSQNLGSFTVNKVVSPRTDVPAAGYTGGNTRQFPYSYVCTIGGVETKSGSGTFSIGTPITVTGVPATSVCVVTEGALSTAGGDFADGSYAWDGSSGAVTLDPIPVNGSRTGTITNYVKRVYQNLTLTKTVQGGGYIGTGEPFSVVVTCGQGASEVTRTVSLASGGSKTVQVPAGVACTVVEQTPADTLLEDAYSWQAPTYTGLTSGVVTVPVGQSRTVGVTNTSFIDKGRISVTKDIAHYAGAVANGTTFAVQVACGTSPAIPVTLTWTGGASDTWTSDLLPVGTQCTVTESNPSGGLVDASYAWTPAPAAQQVAVPQSTQPTLVTVTNDITRVRAPFTIQKVVNKPAGAPTTGGFSGTYSCVYGEDGPVTGTWTAPAGGGAATLSPAANVLLGSVCTAVETTPTNPTDPAYTWTVQQPGSTPVTTTAGGTATVTNTLNHGTGSFSVAKSVTGGAAGTAFADDSFGFSYVCTPQTGEPISGSLAFKAGQSQSVADIPNGSTCVVKETSTPDPIDPYRWDGVTFAGAGGSASDGGWSFTTPTDGASVTVTATNAISKRFGSVAVAKQVTGETAGFTGGSTAMFPVVLVCDGVTYGPETIANGGSTTFSGIPLGASCAASELAFSGGLANGSFAWELAVIGDDVTVTTENGSSGTIAVKNPIRRVYAPVQLTKDLQVGDLVDVVDPTTQFDGEWTCVYTGAGGTASVTGTWAGTDATVNDGGSAQTLTRGGTSATTTDVLVGSVCTPTESTLGAPSTDPSYAWDDAILTPATVTGDGIATMTVVNTLRRDTGDVVVKKVLTGEVAGVTSGTTFPVNAICRFGDLAETFTGSQNLTAGGDFVTLISGVPGGWTCEITEGAATNPDGPALRDASFAWGDTTIEPSSVTVAVGRSQQVVVTNDVERVLGRFGIAKTLREGTPEPSDATFSGAYLCTYDADTTFTGTWSVDGTGAATLTPVTPAGVTSFPLGTTCTVTSEDELGTNEFLPDTSWAWDAPDLGEEVTVAAGVTPTITVTNAAHRVFTDLSVTKVYAGDAAALADDATVTGAWACYYPADSDTRVAGGTWSLPASGGTVTLATADPADDGDDVPAESRCTVTEDTLSDDLLVNSSWAWATPAYEPAATGGASGEVTTAVDETADVTVTNDTSRVLGAFTIVKQVQRDTRSQTVTLDAGLGYSGTWTCELGDESWNGTWGPIPDGGSVVASDIPLGATCTVAEGERIAPVASDVSVQWLPWSANEVVVESVDQRPVSRVTNPLVRLAGAFTVSKTVSQPDGGYVADSTFDFEWRCTADNGDLYPADGPGSFTLADGGTFSAPDGIPVSSECTVTEVGLPDPSHTSYTWSTSAQLTENGVVADPTDGASTTFELGDVATDVTLAAFTNTLTQHTGTFTVSKSIVSAGDEVLPDVDGLSFDVTASWTDLAGDAQSEILTIPGDGTPVSGPTLPIDTEVTLAETSVDTAPAGWRWTGTPTFTIGGETADTFVVAEETAAEAVVTNTLEREKGTFTVGKVVSNPDGVGNLPGSYSLWYSIDGAEPVEVPLAAGATSAAITVPTLVDVTVWETAPGAVPGGSWGTPTWTLDGVSTTPAEDGSVTFQVPADTGVAAVVTNPIRSVPVDVDKTYVSSSLDADGVWTVVYDVDVTNGHESDTALYSLVDTLEFGDGITVTGASWTGPGDEDGGAFADGATSATLATDRQLAAGGLDSYVVTVTATIDPAAWTSQDSQLECTRTEEGRVGGFLNRATVSWPGGSDDGEDCGTPTLPTIEKEFVSATQSTTDATRWTVAYTVTVTGGDQDTVYDLADVPGFPAGVTLGAGTAQLLPDGPVVTIAGDGTIATDVALAAGEVHTYRVLWPVTIVRDPAPGLAECGEVPTQGHGFFNEAAITVGGVVIDDTDCGPIDELVVPSVTKTATSTTEGEDGVWTVTYDVTVTLPTDEETNPKGLAAAYDLVDTLDFGDGIDIESAEWTGPGDAAGEFEGGSATLATGVTITPGDTPHVYQVTVRATVPASVFDAGLDRCVGGEGEGGSGFLNTVQLSSGGVDVEKEACSEPKAPTIQKTGQQAVEHEDGSWTISYLVTVSHEGEPGGEGEAGDPDVVFTLKDSPVTLPTGVTLVPGTWHAAAESDDAPAVVDADRPASGDWTIATGSLKPGQSYTYRVSADVTVAPVATGSDPYELGECPDVEGGGGIVLRNVGIVGSGAYEADDDGCTTVLPPQAWALAKTSDPASGSTVLPGATVTYTLTATNTGQRPVVGAVALDDLTGVLDHAELTQPLPAGLTLDGSTLTWTVPDLPIGESAAVSYTVTVAKDAIGVTLVNVATPGTGGECIESCTTDHPTPRWTISKTSDPVSGSTVTKGRTITYTLTATNVSDAVVSGAKGVDDLSGVLPHATLGTLPSGVTVSGSTLTWSIPDLAPGESATVSYKVTVGSVTKTTTLKNVVAPVGPGGECSGTCTTTHTINPPPTPFIPALGSSGMLGLLGLALLLLAAGATMVLRPRRQH